MSQYTQQTIMDAGLAAVQAYYSRKRSRESQDYSQASTLTTENALRSAYLSSEQAQTKRLPTSSYRLHPAKHLKCDQLLKDMFFPVRTLESDFGFTSITGRPGQINTSGETPKLSARDYAAAGGKWRGLAVFQARYTDETVGTNTAYILSADQQLCGYFVPPTGGGNGGNGKAVQSQFRPFFNSPATAVDNLLTGSAQLPLDICQNVVTSPILTPSTAAQNGGQMFVGRTALNLSTIERDAVCNMPYIPSPVLNPLTPTVPPDNSGPNTLAGTPAPKYWNQNTESLAPPGAAKNSTYAQQYTQGIFRIIDGCISLDISNSDSTTCLVEVVINSMKKTNKDTGIQDFFKGVHDAVLRKNTASTATQISKLEPAGAPTAGGWQAFYDPEYPLLKVPSSTGKNVRSIATEVHRSNHILAPGQTKTVKISLGSLWYTPESKLEYTAQEAGSGEVPFKQANTGSLVVAIGHSGFEAFEALIQDDGRAVEQGGIKLPLAQPNNTRISNTGFWAGKSRSPSSIIVRGNYMEKYYPMSFKPRNNIIRRNIQAPSYFSQNILNPDGDVVGETRIALPGEMIVANRVATATEDGTRSVS